MVHGVLHYCGYKDKSEEDAKQMRFKENHYLDQYNLNFIDSGCIFAGLQLK